MFSLLSTLEAASQYFGVYFSRKSIVDFDYPNSIELLNLCFGGSDSVRLSLPASTFLYFQLWPKFAIF